MFASFSASDKILGSDQFARIRDENLGTINLLQDVMMKADLYERLEES